MRIDFSKPPPDSSSSYDPLPNGSYPCQVESAEETSTRKGQPMWKVRWRVTEGPHSGRIVFDRVSFSEKALPRVQQLLESVGIDITSQIVELEPGDLQGRECLVTVEEDYYTDAMGRRRVGNTVPFDGFKPLSERPVESPSSGPDNAAEIADENLPF